MCVEFDYDMVNLVVFHRWKFWQALDTVHHLNFADVPQSINSQSPFRLVSGIIIPGHVWSIHAVEKFLRRSRPPPEILSWNGLVQSHLPYPSRLWQELSIATYACRCRMPINAACLIDCRISCRISCLRPPRSSSWYGLNQVHLRLPRTYWIFCVQMIIRSVGYIYLSRAWGQPSKASEKVRCLG